MRILNNIEKQKMLDKYFNLYGDSYNEMQINNIKEDFGIMYKDCLTQIYDALGLLNEDENPYIGFRNIIEKNFGLDINILEIGGGVYPALSYNINKRQKEIGKGSITVYDPMLSKGLVSDGVRLVKQGFNYDIPINEFDLIIGKEPCAATEMIIEVCNNDNKSMIISPCKCYGLLPEYIEYDEDGLATWYNYVLEMMEDYDQIKTEYLDEKYNYDNPIYVKKR